MIVFTSGSSTYRYYKLASGLRVYAGDISTSSQQVQDVVVNGMSITANASTTTVALNMSQLFQRRNLLYLQLSQIRLRKSLQPDQESDILFRYLERRYPDAAVPQDQWHVRLYRQL